VAYGGMKQRNPNYKKIQRRHNGGCEGFVVAKLDFEKNILSVKTISFGSIL
jgi:hypothetical protein